LAPEIELDFAFEVDHRGEEVYNALGRTEAGRKLSFFLYQKTWQSSIDHNRSRHEQNRKKTISEKITSNLFFPR